jgi:hypothetical protein
MILSAKEKAEKLINKYFKDSDLLYHDLSWMQAKECALIAVEFARENPLNTNGYNKYLDEVKQEIEKL